MSQRQPDLLEEITEFLRPFIAPLIGRIEADDFTTVGFIEAMQLDETTRAAYQEALRRWPERGERRSKMVIHGQVIPVLLRESGLVEWAGYAYDEPDPYAVPAWWHRIESGETEPAN